MIKLTKTAMHNTSAPVKETAMDKTTRVVRIMLDEETERRRLRTLRLRTARLEREAAAPKEATTKPPKKTRK